MADQIAPNLTWLFHARPIDIIRDIWQLLRVC